MPFDQTLLINILENLQEAVNRIEVKQDQFTDDFNKRLVKVENTAANVKKVVTIGSFFLAFIGWGSVKPWLVSFFK